MKRISTIALLALLASACTNPAGTERAPGYFDGLRPVAREVTGTIAQVGDVFELAHGSEALRAPALADLRVGGDLAIAADRAERLDPGSVYLADHERYLAMIAEVRDIYRSFDEADATGRIAEAAVAATGMEAAAGIGFAGLSFDYCGRVTFDMRLCDRPDDPDGYDAVLFTEMLALAAGYIPLMRPAPVALDPGEAATYLALVNPAAADRLFSAAAALSAAEVPEDRRTDHDMIVGLLLDAAGIHGAGGDRSDLPDLFCETADRLSPMTTAVTDVLFRDDDLDCAPG